MNHKEEELKFQQEKLKEAEQDRLTTDNIGNGLMLISQGFKMIAESFLSLSAKVSDERIKMHQDIISEVKRAIKDFNSK